MTKREKAKAYDEALERVKNLKNTTSEGKAIINYIFPQLHESESEGYKNENIERIPFDIIYRTEIKEGKLLVVTRIGTPVEIIKWDHTYTYPILATIKGDGEDISASFTEKGTFCYGFKSPNDLFLIPNLTPTTRRAATYVKL